MSLKKFGLLFFIMISFSQVSLAAGWWDELTGQADKDFQSEWYRGTQYAIRYGKPFYPSNVNLSADDKAAIYNHTLEVVESEKRKAARQQRASGKCSWFFRG